MTGMLTATLLKDLEELLKKVESTEEQEQDELNKMGAALFTQTNLLLTLLGSNAEEWKEVAEFTKHQSCLFKSQTVLAFLKVLYNIAKLLSP